MNRHDQELLDKQLRGVSSRSPQNGITVLMIVAVFLVGMGIGDIVSKTTQANTHYAALISFPNGQE
jgi:predicted membrane-bound spermidine synthase